VRTVHRRFLITGAVAASVGAAAVLPSFASGPDPVLVQVAAAQGKPVPGRYIVTLKQGASPATTAQRVQAASVQRFSGVLNGFAAKLSAEQLDRLRRSRNVAAIEQDQVFRASTTQKSPPWGLDRIDQRKRPLSKTYYYKATGSGVNAYIVDSGIAWSHPQFEGRAKSVWKAPSFSDGWDCNGHGTHVAGTIGSKTYGVAKKVNLRSLRVLDCNGEGYLSDIIAATNWLRTNAAKPAVANFSLGGSKSAALNTAVTNLSKSGVFVAVAAGNENQNACNTSPASAGWVQAVGASTSYDNRATFSNYGGCVDIFAPGYGIRSTVPGGGAATANGTSMASPHAAGVAALYLQSHRSATFPTVQKWLNNNSTKGRLGRIPSGTPNRLLYKGTL
jgi:subtilisin family serine protease